MGAIQQTIAEELRVLWGAALERGGAARPLAAALLNEYVRLGPWNSLAILGVFAVVWSGPLNPEFSREVHVFSAMLGIFAALLQALPAMMLARRVCDARRAAQLCLAGSLMTAILLVLLPIVLAHYQQEGVHLWVVLVLSVCLVGVVVRVPLLVGGLLTLSAAFAGIVVTIASETSPGFWLSAGGALGILFMFGLAALSNSNRELRLSLQLVEDHRQFEQTVSDHQAALSAKNQQLEQALKSAEQASLTKSDFLAKMSHEMRTPINGIMGMASLALDHVESREQRESLLAVQESAEQLLSLINDILDHSKVEAGKLLLDPIPSNLSAVVRRVERMFKPVAEARSIRLSVQQEEGLHPWVLVDSLRLIQVLNNLIGNAIKFTPVGGSVELRVSSEGTAYGVRTYMFAVHDTGVGIAPEQQLTIFDAFVQADSSVSRTHGGSGLGLTIAANLAALMGGAITLESKLGEGSVFTLRVPLAVLDRGAVPESQRGGQSGAFEREHRSDQERIAIRVLVAEDNPTNRKLCSAMLTKAGFEVLLASDGHETLELLEREVVDIILMDCQMPRVDGYAATRQIRAHADPRTREVPIVALTAHAMDGDRGKCLSVGMNEYLSKPFDRQQLIELVTRLTQARISAHSRS